MSIVFSGFIQDSPLIQGVGPVVPVFTMNQSKTGHIVSRLFRPIRMRAANSNSQDWPLRCIIQGETVTFTVTLPKNSDIGAVKILVHASAIHGVLRGIDSKDLVLCKVSNHFACYSTSINCFLMRWTLTSPTTTGTHLHI